MNRNLVRVSMLTVVLSLTFCSKVVAKSHSHPTISEYSPVAPLPVDTFNVYEALNMSEIISTQSQLTTVGAQIAATDSLERLQEMNYQTQINQINQVISAQKQAQNAQRHAALTEGLSIGLGAVMVVASIACYMTGVGAPAVVLVDDSAMTKQINELNEMIQAPTSDSRREEPAPLK